MSGTGFSEDQMRQKLQKLSNQQESISMLSMWLIHHQKFHADAITQVWVKCVKTETSASKIVNLIYLANDVIQNSRKKCPEFMQRFYPALESALRHVAKIPGPDVMKAVNKVLKVFADRQIYSPEMVARLEQASCGKKPPQASDIFGAEKVVQKEVVYDSEAITQSANEVVASLRKLNEPPSDDGQIRMKLHSCPEVIGNPQMLDTIRNGAEVQALLEQIADVEPLAKDYCKSLSMEMEDRRTLQKQIDGLLLNIRAAVDHQEKLLKDVKRKEEKMKNDLAQIRRAYESLPDLTTFKSYAPLPSAESLFS